MLISNAYINCHAQIVLGRVVSKPALLDSTVVRELVEIGKEFDFPTVRGKTLCTDDFYEGKRVWTREKLSFKS